MKIEDKIKPIIHNGRIEVYSEEQIKEICKITNKNIKKFYLFMRGKTFIMHNNKHFYYVCDVKLFLGE